MPAEVLRCDGEKMKRRLRSAAEQGVIVVLRKKLGVEEAKAAILATALLKDPKCRVARTLGNVWGDLVSLCWEEKGLRGSQGQAWNSDHEGKEAGNHLLASKQPVDFPDEK